MGYYDKHYGTVERDKNDIEYELLQKKQEEQEIDKREERQSYSYNNKRAEK